MTVFRTLTKNPAAATLVFLALFLYIFNIVPPVGPEKLGTREYFSLLASLWIISVLKDLPRTYYWLILANYSQVLFALITMFVNGTTDIWYIQFAIRNVLYINGAIAIAYIIPKSWSFNDLLLLIVLAIVVNDTISLLGYLNSWARSLILSMQHFDNQGQIKNTIKFGVRILGIGQNNFFRGGAINGMGVILAFHLINQRALRLTEGIVIVAFMTVVGLFIARTAIVGFLLGLLLFVWKASLKMKINAALIAIALMGFVLFSNVFSSMNTSHAFEIFYKYDDLDKVQSLHHLWTMYDRDMSFSTLLIGDGLSKQGGFYYGHTDVGYMRNILYFGLIGTIFGYLYYEYYILKKLYLFNKRQVRLIIVMALYLLALNFKGLPDYNFFIFLMISFYMKRQADVLSAVKRVVDFRRKAGIRELLESSR